ncbi:MAG: DUF2914 domain-containing protein [Patescibacteria group bacterium]
MWQAIFQWIKEHEHRLSVVAIIAGFIADNILFTRIDVGHTHFVFAAYTIACFIAIPLHHWIDSRVNRGRFLTRFNLLFVLVIQVALGGFLSGLVIFYGRSAVLGSSWPFILFITLVFLGSEYFHHYHERLVFTSVLFFFVLYSYALFAVPIYTHTLDAVTFVFSGLAALVVFRLFTGMLRTFAPDRFWSNVWRIRMGVFLVVVGMNTLYFTNILPPLPLSSTAAGIYHQVWHVPDAYIAKREPPPWTVEYLGFPPTLHITPGETVYAYSAVFAPTALTTTVAHHWQWHDPEKEEWMTRAVISYEILGGSDGGYRGYSKMKPAEAGRWRVRVETADGRLIDQLPFIIERVTTSPLLETITLK